MNRYYTMEEYTIMDICILRNQPKSTGYEKEYAYIIHANVC